MKKNIPLYLISICFAVGAALIIKSIAGSCHSYGEFILKEFMLESGMVIFAECFVALAVYRKVKGN